MEENRSQEHTISAIKEEVYVFILPFAFLTAGAYQFGYWSTFDINIFPYFHLTEIITSVIYPIMIIVISSFGGFTFGQYLGGEMAQRQNIKSTKFKERLKNVIDICCIILIILVYWKLVIMKWFIIVILGWVVVGANILEAFDDSIFAPKVFKKVLLLLLFLPALIFGHAKSKSMMILNDMDFQEVRLESFKEITLSSKQLPLKYLGQAGDSYFFLTYDNKEKLIIPKEQMKGLFLIKPSPQKIKKGVW
ncbi:MAG TPA: hypothetical protein VF868_03485 [Bacteroidia bacterium]|jgi:hypothetical protein